MSKRLTTQQFAVSDTEFNSNNTSFLVITTDDALSISTGASNGMESQSFPIPECGLSLPTGLVKNFTIHGTGNINVLTASQIEPV